MTVNVKVGSFTRPASAGTDTVVSGLGFAPTTLILLPAHNTTANAWRTQAQAGIYVASRSPPRDPGDIPLSLGSDNAEAAPQAGVSTSFLTDYSGAASGSVIVAGFTLGSDGFTIDWHDTFYDGEQEHVAYLALGGDLFAKRIYAGTIPFGGAGTLIETPYDITAPPVCVLALSADASSSASWSLGVCDANLRQWCMAQAFSPNADPTVNRRRLAADRFIHVVRGPDGSDEFSAVVRGLSPTKMTWEILTPRFSVTEFAHVFLLYGHGVACEAGTFARSTAAAPAAQTVPVIGKPKAALFATVSHTTGDATHTHARGSLGVSDGTNNRAVAWQVEHNVGTSNSDTYFASDKALLVADNATPTIEGASAATFDVGEINLSWNPNN